MARAGTIKRVLKTAGTIAAMLAVMLVAMLLTLRIALHAGETAVPDFSSMTVEEASEAALKAGLDLNIENQFYSTTVPAGRILSQAPAMGSRVRKGWQVRVTESLGPQQVTIPDVTGEVIREATMNLRRNQLDLGDLAHMDAPGEPDIVLAQTPPPDAGVDQPRVSLLLSVAGSGASSAFVLPSFAGMTYHDASRAAALLGLKVAWLGQTTSTVVESAPASAASPTPFINGQTGQTVTPTSAPAPAAPAVGPSGPVLSQTPASGFRVNPGDTVKLMFAHVTIPVAPAAATGSTGTAAPATPGPPAQ